MRTHDESEVTCLRTFSDGCVRRAVPVGTICSNRRTANEATSHDGSIDHWDVNRELVEENGKRRHVCSFQNRWEPGTEKITQTSALLFGMDLGRHNGVGPGGVRKAKTEKPSSIVLIFSTETTP